MAKKIRLTEASNFMIESGSDEEASLESSFLHDSEKYSKSSYSKSCESNSENESGNRNYDAARAQPSASFYTLRNDPHSNITGNLFSWHYPCGFLQASFLLIMTFLAKLPLHWHLHLIELTPLKLFFLSVFVYRKKNAAISLNDEAKKNHVCHVLKLSS